MLTDVAMSSRAFTWFRVWWNFHAASLQAGLVNPKPEKPKP
jgi:hypothetical protein